jgi:hypothetical protein
MSDDKPDALAFLTRKFQEEKKRREAEGLAPPKTLSEYSSDELDKALKPLQKSFKKLERVSNYIAADNAAIVLSLSSDRFKKASPVIRQLAIQIIDIRISKTPILAQKLLLRFMEKDLQGDRKASDLIQKARDLADDWRRGPKYRGRTKRAFHLSLIWLELGKPRDIHRDRLWQFFCEDHPDLLERIKNEGNAKSQAFKDAHLDFLTADKGGSH